MGKFPVRKWITSQKGKEITINNNLASKLSNTDLNKIIQAIVKMNKHANIHTQNQAELTVRYDESTIDYFMSKEEREDFYNGLQEINKLSNQHKRKLTTGTQRLEDFCN